MRLPLFTASWETGLDLGGKYEVYTQENCARFCDCSRLGNIGGQRSHASMGR